MLSTTFLNLKPLWNFPQSYTTFQLLSSTLTISVTKEVPCSPKKSDTLLTELKSSSKGDMIT